MYMFSLFHVKGRLSRIIPELNTHVGTPELPSLINL